MGEYEQKFLNALIQRTTIIQLKNLLHKCELKFSRTVAFSYIQWNHYSEYIVFKVSPTDEQDFRLYETQLESLCYDLYEENEVYDLCGIEIKIKIDDIDTLPVAPEIHFEEIKEMIIKELDNAEYLIWIAMAWFTNIEIYKKLLDKSKDGIIVNLLLDDNDKNHAFWDSKHTDISFEYKAITSNYQNIMHHKFCIIDFKTVMHGTFNWTVAVEYNAEDFTVDKNMSSVEAYAKRFIELRKNK